MSAKTRIVVLHMKEVIYTAVFAALALLLILLLVVMFRSGKKESDAKETMGYVPGVYTSSIVLNNQTMDISQQIYEKQSTEDITFEKTNQYTSTVLLNAIKDALKKAQSPSE